MRKNGSLPLLAFVFIILVAFAAVMAAQWRPALGLDLQGGLSLILEPRVADGAEGQVNGESLNQTKQLIETRINAVGIGESEVTVQGNNILIEIPGVNDSDRVLKLVGKTAELRFRPVLQATTLSSPDDPEARIAELREQLKVPEGVPSEDLVKEEYGIPTGPTGVTGATGATGSSGADATTGAQVSSGATGAETQTPAETPSSTSQAPTSSAKVSSWRQTTTSTTTSVSSATTTTSAVPADSTTTLAPTSTTTTIKNRYGVDTQAGDFKELLQLEALVKTTSSDLDAADQQVVLNGRPKDGVVVQYTLGPTVFTGTTIEGARAGLRNGEWTVLPTFKDGADGIDKFNEWAAKCYSAGSDCPPISGGSRGALAMVLDSQVISAPQINSTRFDRDSIEITGSFTESEASDLALALRYGSLPIALVPQQVQKVSATLGEGALHAGLVAGGIGLGLIVLYLIVYYRLLGLVTVGSLGLSGALLWFVIAVFGETQGLALTLAGIVGIIVSIGVSLDSSVVYFENLREDIRGGRTIRSVQALSFSEAYSTILKADFSSLIGAAILYFLSIGPVRGFAFFLAMSTVIDLLMSYFFMRPATALLARTTLGTKPRLWAVSEAEAPRQSAGLIPAEQPEDSSEEESEVEGSDEAELTDERVEDDLEEPDHEPTEDAEEDRP